MRTLKLELSDQAKRMLDKLAGYGIYGQTSAEVAARFVDQKLIDMLSAEHLSAELTSILRKRKSGRRKSK